ncbi:uncharacterized protein LOC108221043 [Daucus carota subsp. sativus]|uniref:uncharacterized protein LOC108221043 n=1 Tax=Daucus carota subsp. sativus TaxID=79200 RepID=UPI0007EF9FDE|nr:PREDICTED: uncharacterized protein LOC108221043 [Daucus carota subsp. sativus]
MYRGLILLNHLFLIISIFPLQSDATSITLFLRRLAANSRPLPHPRSPLQISPSPSPSPAAPAPLNLPYKEPAATKTSAEPVVTKPSPKPAVTKPHGQPAVARPSTEPVATKPDNKPVATKPDTEPVVAKTCDKLSKKCHINMVTACLGVEGSLLLVLNEDDLSLKVHVTVSPAITYKDIEIPRHQAKKINISDSLRGSSSIVLHAGNENCTIRLGAVVPHDTINPQFPTPGTYITPINGAYIIFASALIIGGTWICFKSWKGRHTRVDGIPYQEVEMGQSDLVSSVNVETDDAWDQSWDDDWDEEKGVKSTYGNFGKSSARNGNITRSVSGGWQNDWDD